MTNKERQRYLDELGFPYEYGSYIGSDGAGHVGIEQETFVQRVQKVTFVNIKTQAEMLRHKEKPSRTPSPMDIDVGLDDVDCSRLITQQGRY